MDDTDHEPEGDQGHSRWPWFAAGALLLTSAAAAAVAVHLHWIPCRGSMLDETAFAPRGVRELSSACLARMDSGLPFPYPPEIAEQAPGASQLGSLGMGLAALAWIVLVLGLPLRAEARWIAMVAAVVPGLMAVGAIVAAQDRTRDPEAYVSGWLWIAVEVVAVAAMIMLWRRNVDLQNGMFLGLAIVLWGSTAFGMIHGITEYVAMTLFNQNNWDTPPGTGWMTVAVLVLAGCGAVVIGGLGSRGELRADGPDPLPPIRLVVDEGI